MTIHGEEVTPVELCEALVRYVEEVGEEMFEKNYVNKDGDIVCSVWCIVGPNAAELTAMVREWANNSGFHRTT